MHFSDILKPMVMDKDNIRVIVGGAGRQTADNELKFESAFVTNSRLMGVLVIGINWSAGSSGKKNSAGILHQLFYIDALEIGIESYKSVRGDDTAALHEAEQRMLGSLGSDKILITEAEARMILRHYSKLNDTMTQPLPDGFGEYGFLLNEKQQTGNDQAEINEDEIPDWEDIFLILCIQPENDHELINYFLMRYYSGDKEAVSYLSNCDLPDDLSPERYDDTLCYNKIKKHTEEGKTEYICESLVEVGNEHRIIVSEIRIEDNKVDHMSIISDFIITHAETAMKLERPEFITVYEIFVDSEVLTEYLDEKYIASVKRDTDCGRLYLKFFNNNNHMKKQIYRLNDDVSGMIYVTNESQLVLAAYSLAHIHRLEEELRKWSFVGQILPLAKYEFKEDIFYDFVSSISGDFIQFVEFLCDIDPEKET